jgi:hypothetical protein
MSNTDTIPRKPLGAALLIALACLALTACGGSSSSSTSSGAATTATAGGPQGPPGGRFAALRACLQKNGVTLPKRTPGQGAPGAGGLLGGLGGAQLPKGTTRVQYEAALRKCGGPSGARRQFNNPTFKRTLAQFATCMRAAGVNLPAPNTTGKGPIFNTSGLSTASSRFKAAITKCQGILRGPGPAGGATGGPGAG